MKRENISVDYDDYSGRDSIRPTISRPPFDALHLMMLGFKVVIKIYGSLVKS